MGGSEQPYLYPSSPYCAPLSERQLAYPYANFNPKARTQAAYQALYAQNTPKPRQNGPLLRFDQPVNSYMVMSGNNVNYTPAAYEALQAKKKTKPEGKGPLINFNQHPDSWQVVSSPRVDYKPMPANTKKKVAAIRWVQFVLRILEEFAALGLLVCMICFKNMPQAFSWIMRIAPAWDVIVTLYAIYHLVRPATARTPASSASYHIFALVNDVGLLPFYVYTCLYARINYVEEPGNKDRWHTLFEEPIVTTDLLLATFIGTAAIAGLHIVSAILDLWLTILFKAIAKLPPDVNPLEDNLTSRAPRKSKHKYKNSEATLTEPLSEKNPAYLSGSTLSVDQASQLSNGTKDVDEADSRKIPFNHTRARPASLPAPQSQEEARELYDDFEEVELYKQPRSARKSRNDFRSPSQAFDKQLSRHALSPSPSQVIPNPPQFTDRASWRVPEPKTDIRTSVPDFAPVSSTIVPNVAPSATQVNSQQKSSLLNDNWYVVDDANSDLGTPSRSRTSTIDGQESMVPQPLKMNPPTPPPMEAEYPDPANEDIKYQVIKRKPLVTRPDNGNGSLTRQATNASSVYSDDVPSVKSGVRPGTPKGKYYGDLAAATRGVLGNKPQSKAKATTEVSRILSTETAKSTGTLGAAAMDSTGMSALSGYGYGIFPERENGRGRVVSRTGVDVADAADGDMGFSMRARRDVSGKVAEEGRGGSVWWSRNAY